MRKIVYKPVRWHLYGSEDVIILEIAGICFEIAELAIENYQESLSQSTNDGDCHLSDVIFKMHSIVMVLYALTKNRRTKLLLMCLIGLFY